jgi:hypothetical protein
VSLAEVYCSIPGSSHIVYTSETGKSRVEVIVVHGGVEVGEVVAALLVPHSFEDRLGFERNGCGAAIPDAVYCLTDSH